MFNCFKWLKRRDNYHLSNVKPSDCPQCSLQQSKAQYKKHTSVAHRDRPNLPDHQNAAPKEIYDEQKEKVVAVQQKNVSLEDNIINDFLQRIFFITVNFGKIKHVAKTSKFRVASILYFQVFAEYRDLFESLVRSFN